MLFTTSNILIFGIRLKEWESVQIAQSTTDDADRAFEKLAYAALRCDPSGFINRIKLQGFEKYLTPFEFKCQIEKSFDIKLSPGEVSYDPVSLD